MKWFLKMLETEPHPLVKSLEDVSITFYENPFDTSIITAKFSNHLKTVTFTRRWILKGWAQYKPYSHELLTYLNDRYERYLISGKM